MPLSSIYNILRRLVHRSYKLFLTLSLLSKMSIYNSHSFHVHETGTGQQVAQLHDRYMMMMMILSMQPESLIVTVEV
jgi:hypothetical protein